MDEQTRAESGDPSLRIVIRNQAALEQLWALQKRRLESLIAVYTVAGVVGLLASALGFIVFSLRPNFGPLALALSMGGMGLVMLANARMLRARRDKIAAARDAASLRDEGGTGSPS